jgi:hypothetical protein
MLMMSPPVALTHARKERLDEPQGAVDIRLEDSAHRVDRHGLDWSLNGRSGVVDENADLACPLDGGRVGDVEFDPFGCVQLREIGEVACGREHLVAAAGKLDGEGASKPTRGSRDKDACRRGVVHVTGPSQLSNVHTP